MLSIAVLLLMPHQFADTAVVRTGDCPSCAVRVERVATLGDTAGAGLLTERAVIAMDEKGRLLLAHMGAPSRVNVYESDGTLLRTIGRAGGGPGEYRRIWQIAPYSGGLLIFDDRSKRSTRLTSEFEFVETRPAPETPLSVVVRSDGSGVMSAIVATPELIGFGLHEFDVNGARVRSLGLSSLPFREDLRALFTRDVSPGIDSATYWSSHRSEYAFEKCWFGRSQCHLFIRAATWFPAPAVSSIAQRGSGDEPPAPSLWGVSQTSPRYVWTIARVPDPEWRSAVDTEGAAHFRVLDWNDYVDTVVECIDLTTNQVVASRRLDAAMQRFIAPGVTWYHREDAAGFVKIEVVRLLLDR